MNRFVFPALVVLVALAASSAPVRAQSVNVAQMDSLIRAAVAEKHIVGLSVGVMQNGKVLLARGYGVRDLASRDAVTPQTMFAVGSVTKQFTCTALLMLVEEKKLSLADPVSKYFPNLTRARDIHLIDLGGHLSGYRDYYPLDFVDQEMALPKTADAIIDEYATKNLDFEPRSRYSYSNTGFLILGRVVEKVSGEGFGGFLSSRVFAPLGLSRTSYEPVPMGDMATGYTSFGLADPQPATPEAPNWAGMAGAIWSTPGDLLTWDRSLLDHTLISAASFSVMATAQRLTDGRSSGYGCGESVNDRGAAVVLSHGGAVSGFVAQNTVIPATHSAVVLLSNTDFSPIGALNQQLVAMVMPRAPDVPMVSGASALDAARTFLTGIAAGTVDRSTLGADFSLYLTAEKVRAAQKALNAMGALSSSIRIVRTSERGGMEVSTVQFTVGSVAAQGLMYRTVNGKIQEFLFSRN